MDSTLEHSQELAPRIRRYSNILTYLQAVFAYHKSLDPRFNYDTWSAKLGFKSRSFMYLICSGRRAMTMPFMEKLASFLGLNSTEKNHLILLASYHKAKPAGLKAIFLDKILENLESNENVMDAKNYFHFVTSKTMPLVKMLLAFDDFSGTITDVSRLLKLDFKKVHQDLMALKDMGLAEQISETEWRATNKAFVVPDDRNSDIMDLFHQQTLNESAEKLKQKDLFKRFRSILFAIHPKDHELLISEIEQFLSKMKNRFGYNEVSGKHVVKLNLQAYPVTETY